ncbi:hypothetical protein PoB_002158200 [Plakobranchus ocellatus]|uniref:Uncharacterized protein n=1 Tax=Plakobranchus ocellatus TaxID=259542 RepID=A0AAV3ZKK9_9GAST|nr:hypothetical protein PoB_002158200 [Plakobranchus ocellatus]
MDAWERFWPVVDERRIIEEHHHQDLNRSIASFNQPISLGQSQSGSRQTDSKVILAAARQTPECFWRPLQRLQSVSGGRHFDSSLPGVESL